MSGAIAVEPISWAQHWSWNEQQRDVATRSPRLLLVLELVVPGPHLTTSAVRDVVRTLVHEHPTLRTTYAVGDRTGLQLLWPAGAEMFALTEGEAGDGPDDGLSPREIDICSTWPLAVRIDRGEVGTQVTLTLHHIAVDNVAYGVVRDRLAELLAAAAHGLPVRRRPEGLSSLDVARFEASPAGTRVQARALDHWLRDRDLLDGVLDSLRNRFDEPSGQTYVARVISRPAAAATERLVALRRSTPAGVAVAAVAAALSDRLGFDAVPLHCIVNNRHVARYRSTVCTLAQPGLVRVVEATSFESALRGSAAATLEAARHARYDPSVFGRLDVPYRGFDTDFPLRLPTVNYFDVEPRAVPTHARTRELADGAVDTWVMPTPCAGLLFGVHSTAAGLVVELRAASHLADQELTCEFVLSAAQNIVRADP